MNDRFAPSSPNGAPTHLRPELGSPESAPGAYLTVPDGPSRAVRQWSAIEGGLNRKATSAPAFHRLAPLLAAAAMLLLLLSGAGLLASLSSQRSQVAQQPARSNDPVMSLPDGSTIVVGQGAHLTSGDSTSTRTVYHLRRGSAVFDVTRNERRTFVVKAAGVTVRVLGTRFSVEVKERQVRVAVDRGLVEVIGADGSRRRVPAGDAVSVAAATQASSQRAEAGSEAGSREAGDGLAEAGSTAIGEGRTAASRRVAVTRRGSTRQGSGRQEAGDTGAGDTGAGQTGAGAVEQGNGSVARARGDTSGEHGSEASRGPTAAALWSAAERARLAGNFARAARLLEQLHRQHPKDPRARIAALEAGRLRMRSRQPEAALKNLDSRGAADDELVALNRLRALHRLERWGECQAELGRFLKRFPESSQRTAARKLCRPSAQ